MSDFQSKVPLEGLYKVPLEGLLLGSLTNFWSLRVSSSVLNPSLKIVGLQYEGGNLTHKIWRHVEFTVSVLLQETFSI